MFILGQFFINHHILHIGTLIAKGGTLIEKPYNSQMYDKN